METAILGKYVPRNTIIHKVDPRVKLFLMIVLMVAVFLSYGSYVSTLIVDGLILVLILSILLLSKIQIRQIFSSLKVLWLTMILLFIINIFIPNGNYSFALCNWNGFSIYLESIFQSIKIIVRIAMMILLTLILTATTKTTDISYAFEWYLSPLKLIKIPVSIFAMIISLTLRFIPTILEETARLKKAQESRGVDFEHGKLSRKLRAMFSLLIPLLISSLSRSNELAEALTVRGYIPNAKRTRYEILRFSYLDIIALLTICLVSAGFFILSYYQFDLLKVIFNFQNEITVLGI